MASLTFQRATWCLKLSRTSRLFTVSFTTSLPRNGRLRRLPSEITDPFASTSRPRSTAHAEARRAYHTTRVYRAQQATSPTPAAAANPPSTSQPPPPANNANLTEGLNDPPPLPEATDSQTDWSRSFKGLSTEPFTPEATKILLAPIPATDIEVKPDGIVYLPEIKYRRILNKAFGPGGWGLAPRGETIVTAKAVTREYALVALGRLVSIARGEQDYFSPEGIPSAVEGCKSTALRRCCKDLGIASELWDPAYVRKFLSQHVKEIFVEHAVTKKKRKHYMRKDDVVRYPWKESKFGS